MTEARSVQNVGLDYRLVARFEIQLNSQERRVLGRED